MVYFREIIPIHGRKIQVSEILQFTQINVMGIQKQTGLLQLMMQGWTISALTSLFIQFTRFLITGVLGATPRNGEKSGWIEYD